MPYPDPTPNVPRPWKRCNLCGAKWQVFSAPTCPTHSPADWDAYQAQHALPVGYPHYTLLDENTMQPLPPPVGAT